MTTHIINDPVSLSRQEQLLAYFEESAGRWYAEAARAREVGEYARARRSHEAGETAAQTAGRIRMRLVALSGLTEGDVAVSDGLADLVQRGPLDTPPIRVPVQTPEHLTPDPPAKLMDLYHWLRKLLGSRFPWVTSESWQRVAWLLLVDRGRS